MGSKRIVIMAGGTGGHVFPALAVALFMREKGWEVSWLGTQKGLESRVVPEQGIAIDWLSVSGIRGKGLLSKMSSIFKLIQASGQAFLILRQRKPNIVLGMGGFVAGPGGIMAKLLGIPLVIHEQNRIPGTSNKLLAKVANRVLEAFPGSFSKSAKATCTGNPLRSQFLLSKMEKPSLQDNHLRVLIIGGSQGAKALNEAIPKALVDIQSVEIKHQTGSVMLDEVAKRYAELGISAEVTAFIQDMVAAYLWADIIICRAGAMTISEVAAMGLPAILVPLPNAIDDHQMANARYLADAGGAMILPQQELMSGNLSGLIKEVQGQLGTMAKAAKTCARLDATQSVADICNKEAIV